MFLQANLTICCFFFRNSLTLLKVPMKLWISFCGFSAYTCAEISNSSRSDPRRCVDWIARRSFQSVSPSSWSVRMKQAPLPSLVRRNTMSAGTRWSCKIGHMVIIDSLSSGCVMISEVPAGSSWKMNRNVTFSTMMRSPTRMSALETDTTPPGVNFLYFLRLISRSRRKRRMSSIASRIIVTQITNVCG